MVFIESRLFTARLMELAKSSAEQVLSQIQQELLSNPTRGRIVPGTSGVRKARVGNPERKKGTRGGFRYFYLYLQQRDHIHLLTLLDKGEQEDLSNDERNVLKALVGRVKKA